MCSACPKPVGMFGIVSPFFSFSLEEVPGFSTPAWASRQKGILAPFNPEFFGFVSILRDSQSEPPLCARSTGFIPDVVVSHANSSRTEWFPGTWAPDPCVSLEREIHKSIVPVPESLPLPRGRRGTEPLSRTTLVAEATGGLGRSGLFSKSMRLISELGVLETLNPTDDGSFGKGRNTYGTL